VALALLCIAGCTAARKSTLPAPRVRDAGALCAEAAARPADAEPFYQLALLHAEASACDSALVAVANALRRDPQHAPSLALLARLLHDAGRSEEALHYYELRGIDTFPDAVMIDIALLYADVGNTLEARKLLRPLAAGSHAAAVAANLAYLDLLDEDNAAALAALETQAARFPDSPEVQQNLALARLRAGDVESGALLLERVASEHPEFATGQHNLALLLRHYRFDAEGAARVAGRAAALDRTRRSELALERILKPGVEDAAPPAPQTAARPEVRP
jgi:tetratricopeptide (TPR) repeat protein